MKIHCVGCGKAMENEMAFEKGREPFCMTCGTGSKWQLEAYFKRVLANVEAKTQTVAKSVVLCEIAKLAEDVRRFHSELKGPMIHILDGFCLRASVIVSVEALLHARDPRPETIKATVMSLEPRPHVMVTWQASDDRLDLKRIVTPDIESAMTLAMMIQEQINKATIAVITRQSTDGHAEIWTHSIDDHRRSRGTEQEFQRMMEGTKLETWNDTAPSKG